MLKLWVLVLDYKSPKKCLVLPFYGFTWENLGFPSVKSSKSFTKHRIQRDTNFKPEKSRVCEGRFFDFGKFMSFPVSFALCARVDVLKYRKTLISFERTQITFVLSACAIVNYREPPILTNILLITKLVMAYQ